jgi:hypothetical protein
MFFRKVLPSSRWKFPLPARRTAARWRCRVIAFDIRDHATEQLSEFFEHIEPSRGILGAMATAVKKEVQDNFLQQPPNKQGFPSSNFWPDAARSTSTQVEDDQATVTVNKLGVLQRLEGGDIDPVRATYLAIAAIAPAYNHSPREFPFLHFGFALNQWGKLQPALIEAQRTELKFGAKRKDGTRKVTPTVSIIGGGVFFWLTKHVHQDPNPDVLPTTEEMSRAALDAGNEFLERQKEQGGIA